MLQDWLSHCKRFKGFCAELLSGNVQERDSLGVQDIYVCPQRCDLKWGVFLELVGSGFAKATNLAATRHRHILQEPTEKADGKEPEKMDLEAKGSFDAEPGSIERLKTCIRCYKIDSLTVKDSKGSVLNCLVEMFRKEIHLGFRISMFVLKDVIWNGVFSFN